MTEANPETAAEKPVVAKVKEAIDAPWKKPENSEYWEIRKQLEKRLAWHGMGVTKHFVDRMDAVSNVVFKDKGILRGVAKTLDRAAGLWLGATAASADIVYNSVTTLLGLRRILPIPKDLFKRAALYGTYALEGASYGVAGVVGANEATKKVIKTALFPGPELGKLGKKMVESEGYQKGLKSVREVGEAAFTAPEVAGIKIKQKVDAVIERMKKPNISAKV